MSPALLLLMVAAPSANIFVGERTPVALYLVSPPGAASTTPSASILGAVESALAADTSLELWSMERAGAQPSVLDECPLESRLTCWTRAMQTSKAQYLWALAVQPLPDGRDRLLTIFLDVEAATKTYRTALDSGEGQWREHAEQTIFSSAAMDGGASVDGSDPRALAAYFEGVVQSMVEPMLTREGRWRPFGQILLSAAADESVISVDGKDVGVVRAGATVVDGIAPGIRTIETLSGTHRQVHEVDVRRAESTPLTLTAPPVPPSPVRVVATYGGLAIAATGVAIAVWSVVRASDAVQSGCLTREGESGACTGLGGLSFGYDPSRGPTSDPERVDPGGLKMGPLGLGLVTMGSTWTVGSLFVEEHPDAPWWSIVVGTVAGIVVYGLSHVLVE